jgi:hypothetical protein
MIEELIYMLESDLAQPELDAVKALTAERDALKAENERYRKALERYAKLSTISRMTISDWGLVVREALAGDK